MSSEELLKPRWKVIADYPGCSYEVGEILEPDHAGELYSKTAGYSWTVSSVKEDTVKNFPHLFQKLEWYQERDIKEMPEYFKIPEQDVEDYSIGDNSIHSVSEEGKWGWNEKDAYIFNYKKGGGTLSSYLLPATEQEFINFKGKDK